MAITALVTTVPGTTAPAGGDIINANFTDVDTRLKTSTSSYSTTSRTLALTDAGKSVDQDSASATVVTVPLNATVAFPVDTVMEVVRLGAGAVSIAFTGGITVINPMSSLNLRAQGSTATLRRLAASVNTWHVTGDFA